MSINVFKTLKAKKEYYQKLIYTIGLCESVKSISEPHYNEFCELFKCHPEYPMKVQDMVDLRIEINMRNSTCYALYMIKQDSSIEDISYLSCCKNNVDKYKNLKNAMRFGIQAQINEYRFKNHKKICVICESRQNIQVDHHEPSFKQLYNDFLKTTENIPHSFDDNFYNSAMFKEDDNVFSNDWGVFHKHHCNLRYLCRSCNLKNQ